MAKIRLPTGLYGFTRCDVTDLLKDYVVIHERIKALYKMLETPWYLWDSVGLMKFKENMENASVRRSKIRDMKNEIKRYHRMQSNIQNVLNDMCIGGKETIIYRKLESRSPSQFKNGMYYTYYIQSILS